jgi:tRNA (guanine-N7-)-methyltransferase
MTTGQLQAIENLWPVYGIETGDETLNLDALFRRSADVVLEIGFGNGDTLVEQARQHPQLNFLGVEVHMPGVGHCLLQLEQQDVHNLRLITADAIDVLQRQIAAGSLRRVNLYFPDPWPKKRHHKRRIIQTSFLQLIANSLKPGGEFFIATDWAGYAEHIDAVLALDTCFELRERREHAGDAPLDRVNTKFERRGLGKGHSICDWRLQRL